MRQRIKLLVLGLGSLLLLAGSAQAAVNVDASWWNGSSTVNTTTITSGFSGSLELRIFLTTSGVNADRIEAGLFSIQWTDNAQLGTPTGFDWAGAAIPMGGGTFGTFGSSSFTGGAGCPAGNGCYGSSFGGTDPNPGDTNWLPHGTYQVATLVWNVTAGQITVSQIDFSLFIRTGFDVFGDTASNNINGIVTGLGFANGPVLNVTLVPEPTTASLLALGLVGLVVAGRRKQA